jgi:hypothetical protein
MRDSFNIDLVFPIRDDVSAWLMCIKGELLYDAGIINGSELNTVIERAAALMGKNLADWAHIAWRDINGAYRRVGLPERSSRNPAPDRGGNARPSAYPAQACSSVMLRCRHWRR